MTASLMRRLDSRRLCVFAGSYVTAFGRRLTNSDLCPVFAAVRRRLSPPASASANRRQDAARLEIVCYAPGFLDRESR